MSNEEKQGFAAYPDEIKDALLVDDYVMAMFTRQSIEDLIEEVKFFSDHCKKIIENFKKLGGQIGNGIDDEGNIVRNEIEFHLGQTIYSQICDKNGLIVGSNVYTDYSRPRASEASELLIIYQVAEALFYVDAPKDIEKLLEMKKKDKWNNSMIKGIARTADDIRKESRLYGFGLAGSNVEKDNVINRTPANKTIIGELKKDDDKPTEYRGGE